MNKKVLISIGSLVVLMLGSYLLYQQITKKQEANSLVTEAPQEQKEVVLNNIRDEAFNFELEDEQGEKVMLDSFIGKPIVLNFWASWCPPCREEMPIFAEQQEANPNVVFLYVNQTDGTRETKEKALSFMQNEGLTMPIHFDQTNDSAIKYGLTALPSTYFIDEKGDIRNRAVGALPKEGLMTGIAQFKNND